jgi:hypothetical protein
MAKRRGGVFMDMPKPSDNHKKMQALAGTWRGEEQIHPSPWDPKGGSAVGKIVSRMDLDGFFLISDYLEERDGAVHYKGHGVYGWDPKESCFTMYWFDSMGGAAPAGPAKGTWEGNVLTFRMQNPMGHSKYVYTFDGDGRYRFGIEQSQDGKQWATFMEGRYTRL